MLSKLRSTLAGMFALLLATSLGAQNFLSGTVIPVSGNPQLMATADFNRDGKPDIVYMDAYQGGILHILLERGDGTFSTGQIIAVPQAVGTVITLGDINGDGVPDIVLGYTGFAPFTSGPYANPSISVYLGKGDGTFQPLIASPAFTYGSPASIIFHVGIADFDGDGHPDLIYSDDYEYLYFMKGDGHGHFAQPVMLPGCTLSGDVFAADLNGDGRPDLIVACNYSFDTFLNQGNATFAAPTAYGTNLYETGQKTLGIGDINGDGYLDVLYGDFNEKLWAAYGHSDGTFTAPAVIASVPNHYPAILGVADLKGDNKPRALLSSPDGVTVALGATPGGTQMYAGTGPYSSQNVIADFNGDGLVDVAVPGDQSIVILFGKSDGTFAAAPSIQTNTGVGGLAILDDTGDNIPDVTLSSSLLFPGNGDGTFGTPIGLGGGYPSQLYSGDFDGNGHLGFYSDVTINHNNGNGTFTLQPLPSGLVSPTGFAAIADFNADGRADVALSTSLGGFASPSSSGNLVYIANSASGGTYTYTSLNFSEPVGPLGAGDFNGDDCPDFAVGAATQIEVFIGDCKGNFHQSASYPTGTGATVTSTVGGLLTSLEPSDIALADFDGDGHLDIVYTIPGSSLAKLLYGNGDGTFTARNDLSLPHSSLYVTTADLNSDGSPDLIFTGQTLATIYYGQKSRSYSAPTVLAAGFTTGKAVVSDLNRDGSPDIVIPNLNYDGGDDSNDSGFTFTVFMNRPGPLSNPTGTGTATITTLTCNPSVLSVDTSSLFSATVSSASGTPTGSILFTDNGATLTQLTLTNGVASYNFTARQSGTRTIVATYAPTGSFAASSASCVLTVSGSPTIATLSVSPTLASQGSPVTLTASVSGGPPGSRGSPVGSITFYNGSTVIDAGAELQVGTVSFTTTTLPPGIDYLTCTYSGNAVFAPSTCNVVPVTITQTSSVISLTSSLNPAPYPTSITFTAQVAPGSSGTITFNVNGQNISTTPNAAGTSTTTTSALTPGSYLITATYLATPNALAAQASLDQVVIVPVAAPDFSLTGANTTFQINHTGTGKLLLYSLGTFAGSVALTCNPPYPPGYTCTLQTSNVSLPLGFSTYVVYTLSPSYSASIRPSARSTRLALAALFPLSFFGLMGLARRRRATVRTLLCLIALTALASMTIACGPDQFIPISIGTYPITFTGVGTTQNSPTPITHTVTINATITP